MPDKERGLYNKFSVQRTDGRDATGQKHDGCRYFVLDITHDDFAVDALATYMHEARKAGYELLADDLRELLKYGIEEKVGRHT